MKRIARVFPRKTNATPDDELSFIGTGPPLLAMPEIDEVHVSVAFTWDLPAAEWLAEQWLAAGVPVKLGGPALNDFSNLCVLSEMEHRILHSTTPERLYSMFPRKIRRIKALIDAL